MYGCTGVSGATITPASPARHVPATNVFLASRPVRRPTASASSGLPTIALMRAPVGLRRYHTTSPLVPASESTISNTRYAGNGAPSTETEPDRGTTRLL